MSKHNSWLVVDKLMKLTTLCRYLSYIIGIGDKVIALVKLITLSR